MKKITLLCCLAAWFTAQTVNAQTPVRFKNEVFTDAQIMVQNGIKFGTNFNWLIINQTDLASPANGPQVIGELTQLKTLLATKKAIPMKYYIPKAAPGGDSTILKVTDLKMDAYMPNPSIDNMAKRPIIIYLHTGNFLPPGINGSPCGDKGDSSSVEICKGFARRGFIAISIDYRLGWNPIATTVQERRGTLLNAVYRSIHDTKECVRVIKGLEASGNPYKFDGSKIALFGEGTGGYIALAYNSLDKVSEMELPKFINPLTGKSYIDTSKVGYIDGTKGLFNLYAPSTVNTKIQVAANIGGAFADSSWMEAGDAPIVSMHCVRDPFAPFNEGTVIVPTTNEDVVDVVGANIAVRRAVRLGNNAVFASIPNGDPYTKKARSLYNRTVDYIYPSPDDKIAIKDGEGMYPVLLPKGPAVLFNQASPWQWWDSTTAAATRIVAAPSTTAHMASKASNMDMSKAKSKRYQDTIHGYITPRLALAMGLLTANELSVKQAKVTGVSIYPNPASSQVNISYDGKIEEITVTDLSGKVVYRTAVNANSFTIPTLNIGKGIYFVNVSTENGVSNEKLIVQ